MRRAQRPRNSVTPFPSRLLARRSDPAWHDRLLASRRGGRATSVVIDDRSRSVFLECVVSGRPLALTLCCPASPSRCTLGQLLGRGTAHASMMCHISHGGGALRLPWLGYGAKRRTLHLGIGRRPIPHCTFYLGMSRGPIPSCTLHLGMSLQPIPRYKVCKGRAYEKLESLANDAKRPCFGDFQADQALTWCFSLIFSGFTPVVYHRSPICVVGRPYLAIPHTQVRDDALYLAIPHT